MFFCTAAAHAQGFPENPEALQDWLEQRNVSSVSAFAQSLPDAHKKNWAMAYSSESLQSYHVGPSTPRVISYGDDAKWLIAVAKDSNIVEILYFNDKKSRFEPAVINFASATGRVDTKPNSCIRCHGTDIRPNWEHWREPLAWPNFYGSNHENILQDGPERKLWADFLEKSSSDPLYAPFLKTANLDSLDGLNENWQGRNLRLNDLLDELNRRRIARILVEWELIDRYGYAILGISKDCSIDGFLSDAELKKRQALDEKYKETFELSKANALAVLENFGATAELVQHTKELWTGPYFMRKIYAAFDAMELGEDGEPNSAAIHQVIGDISPLHRQWVQAVAAQNWTTGDVNAGDLISFLNYSTAQHEQSNELRWLLDIFPELKLNEWSMTNKRDIFSFGDAVLLSPSVVSRIEAKLNVPSTLSCEQLQELSLKALSLADESAANGHE